MVHVHVHFCSLMKFESIAHYKWHVSEKVWTPKWHRTLVTAILKFICFILIKMFVMANDQILNIKQISNVPGTN